MRERVTVLKRLDDCVSIWAVEKLAQKLIRAVYSIDHERLHLCVADPGQGVPLDFSIRRDNFHVGIVTRLRARMLSGMKIFKNGVPKTMGSHHLGQALTNDFIVLQFSKLFRGHRLGYLPLGFY